MKSAVFRLLKTRRRVVLYCPIGISGVTLGFLIYSLLTREARLNYEFANAAGYFSGTVPSFFLNAHFNFRKSDWFIACFLSFCAVAFLGWTTSSAILYKAIGHFGWNKYLAKLATIAVAVLLQYNLKRLLSFRKIPL